jgi:class 3 adenylate cyclase/tetratricopeptide (TPR) repeat protein
MDCPSCGSACEERFNFCPECGTPLDAPARRVVEERKVVTCLFCDLVGFTATSESADPEDVNRMLSAYSEMARDQIESHGGVVEKFIGDAVVGIFGVPAAHEDDPERAVRAGLRIVERADELEALGGEPLRLRVGINTGEALVRLRVIAGSGERHLAGDPINTASRLQSAAPEMGVVVGLGTYEATATVFEYEEREPVAFKGKAEPVRVFHAKAPIARDGTDLDRTHDAPFIGREIDLALLRGIFDKVVAAGSVQLVVVSGEPGLGKSRIVAELGAYVDSKPDLITWRQGRCLPYGEGISFWALGEILKGHAGILESDTPDAAAAKLEAILPDDAERPWFRERLLPLLGIEAASNAERDELFAAWRRFLAHIAERDPTVVVFEDLHWADDAMLAFLEHLASRAEAVPLLVIGTARPELFERHPDFGSGLGNVTVIGLAPLSDEETARLVSALLESTMLPAELARPIVDRADGNPLYAKEFVRLLRDRGLLIPTGSSWELKQGADIPFPDSVQALIAARLDSLGAEAKSMLADAAVIGKVFWAGGVAAMGSRDLGAVTHVLRDLSRREFVRPLRRSSMEHEAEYAFSHALTRDVAYSQLPRVSRASRHVAAATWIESKAPGRVEDLSDVLAHHYATAVELERAAGQVEQAGGLEASALRFLTLAGERAVGLDTAAALASFERALNLAPPGHPARPDALVRFGKTAQQAGRFVEASAALEEATSLYRAAGDLRATARAMVSLSRAVTALGDPRQWTLPVEALDLLEPLPPGPELIEALSQIAANETFQARPGVGVRYAERALAVADGLGLPQPVRALGFRGMSRISLGDASGLEDMRSAIALAEATGEGREVAMLQTNLGFSLWTFEGPAASLEVLREGIAFARSRGLAEIVDAATYCTLDPLVDLGEHEEVLEIVRDLGPRLEQNGDREGLVVVQAAWARIAALRGQASLPADSLARLESDTRSLGFAQVVPLGLGSAALARAMLGEAAAAAALIAEVDATPADQSYLAAFLPAMTRTAIALGDRELAERLIDGFTPRYPYSEHALVAADAILVEASGDPRTAGDAYASAADRWERFGVVPELAFALLGQGRCLLRLSRSTDATSILHHAREIFERLRAGPALADVDGLIRVATALSS